MMKIHIDYDMMKQDLDNVIYKDGIHNGELNKYDADYSDEDIFKVWHYIIAIAYKSYYKGLKRAETEFNR